MGKKWAIFDLDNTIAKIDKRLAKATVNGKLDYKLLTVHVLYKSKRIHIYLVLKIFF